MEDYKSNSHKSKSNAKKKIEKVVSGNVKSKKKGELHKFTDVFISEDASNVKSYIFMDVLIPAIKKALYDIVTGGLEMSLYGGTNKNRNPGSPKVPYRNYYRASDEIERSERLIPKSVYDYDDIFFDNRGDAERVLMELCKQISDYGTVSVADFYEFVGITGNHTDYKYGWSNLHNARVVHTRSGYIINLPKALPLD